VWYAPYVQDAEIWLQSALSSSPSAHLAAGQPVEKFYFLSVRRVSYGREADLGVAGHRPTSGHGDAVATHRLVVQDLRGAWTKVSAVFNLVLSS